MSQRAARVVVVLGMHRSGTSLLANVLHLLGVGFGERLLAGGPDNPRGFWEHVGVVALHEEILARLDRAWPGPHASLPYPEGWWREARFADVKARMRALLEEELARARAVWGFKDPRTCRLLGIWHEVFAEMGIAPQYVLALRHPAAVCASLARRDGFSLAEAGLLWLEHALEPLAFFDGRMPVAVDFDEWLGGDAAAPARRLAEALGLAGAPDAAALAGAVTPELRHHTAADGDAPALALEAYRLLRATRAGEPLAAGLLRIASAFAQHQALFRGWADALERLTDPELAHRPLDRAMLMDDERARWRQGFAAAAGLPAPNALPVDGRPRHEKLRICLVGDALDALARRLAADGHEVTCRALESIPAADPPLAGSEAAQRSWNLYQWLAAEQRFDMVHAHASGGALYHALMARRHGVALRDTTFVVHAGLDAAGHPEAGHMERRAAECADYLVAVSDAALSAWRARGVVLPLHAYLAPPSGAQEPWLAWHRRLALARERPPPPPAVGAGFGGVPLFAAWDGADTRADSPYILFVAKGAVARPGAEQAMLDALLHSGGDACICLAELQDPGGAAPRLRLSAPALLVRRAALPASAAALAPMPDADALNALQASIALAGYCVDTLPAALYIQREPPAGRSKLLLRLKALLGARRA